MSIPRPLLYLLLLVIAALDWCYVDADQRNAIAALEESIAAIRAQSAAARLRIVASEEERDDAEEIEPHTSAEALAFLIESATPVRVDDLSMTGERTVGIARLGALRVQGSGSDSGVDRFLRTIEESGEFGLSELSISSAPSRTLSFQCDVSWVLDDPTAAP